MEVKLNVNNFINFIEQLKKVQITEKNLKNYIYIGFININKGDDEIIKTINFYEICPYIQCIIFEVKNIFFSQRNIFYPANWKKRDYQR